MNQTARASLFVSIFLSFFAAQHTWADRITGPTFQRWGQEILTQIQNRYGRGDGLYRNSLTATWPDYVWGQGVILRALAAAAKVDSAYLQRAEQLVEQLRLHYWCTQNQTSGFNSSYGGCGDRYYDDNAWLALALLDLYELTGNSKYLGWAQETVVFCMSGENGPADSPNGGIRWHESDTGGASVCSTAPTILANLILYQKTAIEHYKTDGQRLYSWIMNSDLRYDTGLFHETNQGALGYQTAVMTQAAVRLYQITGSETYLAEAERMAAAMEHVFINRTTQALTQHGKWGGHDMTNAYADLYESDGNSRWLDTAAGYLEFLYVNCIDPSNGLYPAVWNDTSRISSADMIDNASVALAYWRMASTPGGTTPHTWFAERLIGRWMLDETSGTLAADSSGFGCHGTLCGDSFAFEQNAAAGPWNGALLFDGVDDYIDLPDGFANFRGGMTVSVWAYPTAVKNWARFLDFGNGQYNNNIVFGRYGNSNDLFFEGYDGTASGGQVRATGAIVLHQWQMFTATLDASGNVLLYKDGVQIASGTTAVPSNIQRVNNYIGRSNWSADAYFEGRLDDVRICNYALTPEEVQLLYRTGGQAENPAPPTQTMGTTDVISLEWTAGSLAAAHLLYLGTEQIAVLNAAPASPEYKGRQTSTLFRPSLVQDTAYYWRVDEETAEQDIAPGRLWTFTTAPYPTQGLFVHYPMDSAFISGSTLLDSSPSQNHALLVGPVSTAGLMADALSFDGVDDYVRLPEGFADFTGGMTVNVWVYPTAAGFWARFLDLGCGSASNNIVFARQDTSNTLSFEAYNGSVSGGKATASGTIALNQWQMLTAVLDASGYVKLFKNGTEIAAGKTAVPPIVNRTRNYIGKSNWSGDAYFRGSMDDLALWSRPLSNAEIARLYARGLTGRSVADGRGVDSPTAYWSFNEAAGTTTADASGNGRNGVLVNMDFAARTAGKQCGGLFFDGVDDYVEVAGYKGVLGPASRTCTAWVKTTAARQVCILSWGSENSGQKWFFRVEADGTVSVGVWGGYVRTTSTSTVNDGRWHHAAAVFANDGSPDISEIRLYVDGILQAALSSNEQTVNTAAGQNVMIGAFKNAAAATTGFFEGYLDEVRIYDRSLSDEDIFSLYRRHALISDFTKDGIVDLEDLAIFGETWLDSRTCEGDLTCDCQVNLDDLSVLAREWLEG